MTVHLGSHFNETAVVTEWHINGTHYLENWSDTRAYDGTATVIQPMIEPLYGGKSAHDVIQSMLSDPDTSPYDAVRKTWQSNLGTGDTEHAWRKILHDGMVAGTAFQPKTVSSKIGDLAVAPASDQDGTVEVIFRADPNIYDGRYANVGWLQEIPKPVTSMSWDNAALMSYRTLAKFGLAESGCRSHRIERQYGDGPGPRSARPSRWLGHAIPGLCPSQRRPGCRGVGLQRVRDPNFQRPVVRFWRDHEENRPDL